MYTFVFVEKTLKNKIKNFVSSFQTELATGNK